MPMTFDNGANPIRYIDDGRSWAFSHPLIEKELHYLNWLSIRDAMAL